MSGPCPYVCFNKTEYGYCRGTVCTNKSVIEYLTNKACNTRFTYDADSKCYRIPCTHCGGVGYLIVDTTSTSPVQCPVCMGVGDVVHVESFDSNEEDDKGSNPCNGCKHISIRYPYASMYPCNNCIRANMKDYYEPQEESNG